MEFSYVKKQNTALFETLEDPALLNVELAQNYVPLYTRFFSLNSTNYNHINLNNKLSLNKIISKERENIYTGILVNSVGIETAPQSIFVKFSPLLDPIKYMLGKYDITDSNLLNLPKMADKSKQQTHRKVEDTNNAAYVDSFFTYLTSQMLHVHAFEHGVDFFGSFLAIKNEFEVNVYDDIDYLYDSAFFNRHNKSIFTIEENWVSHSESNTRDQKKRLNLNDSADIDLGLADINELAKFGNIFSDSENKMDKIDKTDKIELSLDNLLVFDGNSITSTSDIKKKDNTGSSKSSASSSCSSCSSRSSNTDGDGDDNEDDGNKDEIISESGESECKDECDNECKSSESEAEEDGKVIARIKQFPVQLIALECCDNTLDSLLITKDGLKEEEWGSIVIQILFMLITYQNVFCLTHNDLHTNNIMFIKTKKTHLYYKYKDQFYKVPTFGRLFKIIDFGRAIYKFRDTLLCSDSFHLTDGDAATQYNCEPYYNAAKIKVEPNYSFDLCRLGCSLFDFLIDDMEDVDDPKMPAIIRIIIDWCLDDKERNVLYKNNGDERYQEFKLYKMIARTVHNHVPATVLKNKFFEKYIVLKKKINKRDNVMNIDMLPCYV